MNTAVSLARLPTAADVDDAARVLANVAVRTPLLSNAALDQATGGRVFLKAEIFQRTGSFKFRGAYNRIARIPAGERAGGVVAFSSGNHAQGVAAAAKLCGLPALIVMPADAPAAKIARTKSHGAEVVFYDREREDREEIGRKLARERGATLVPPFDDPFVIAGQGTIGREICEDLAALALAPEVVLMPASGGGLAAGISLAVKARHPAARILTVEPADYDDHARSFRAGKRVRGPHHAGSICDALLMPEPGKLTFEITRRLVGEGLAVTDDEVRAAMRFAFSELKAVVEPGGAVALAALLARKIDVGGKVAAAVLSGGNVDAKLFAETIAG
ncbi:MAG TPA: threonine/serine dehydratase [Xanthobacteraceae bacterium]|nr:threonine/serine dehydratase [Xanthobacteraceae bacterium]